MLVFLHPDADPQGAGFHINQSLIAVGTGGFTGRGYMEGMQKLFYLPEASHRLHLRQHRRGTRLHRRHVHRHALRRARLPRPAHGLSLQDPFARLTAFGITTAILLQAFFNISVVLSLLPTKGIPLPFISSGGTSPVLHAGRASGSC